MSAGPPEVLNNHKNDPETKSRRAKKVLKKRRKSSSTSSISNLSGSSGCGTRKIKRYKKKHKKKRSKRRRQSSSVEIQPKRSDMLTELFRFVDENKQFNRDLTHPSWQNTKMTVLIFSFRRNTSKTIS